MEKCLKSSENRNERILRNISIVMLSLFALLAYLDVIASMVPFVLASYGVMSVLSVVYIIFYFIVRKNSFSFDVPNISFFCFAIFTLISMILKKGSLDRDAVAIFNLLQIVSVCLTLFVLKNDLNRIIGYFCYFVILFSLFILLNSLSIFTELRSQGITPNTNALGGLMSISIMCSISLLASVKNKFVKGLSIVNILISIVALYMTYSRGAELSLFIGIFVLLFFYITLKSPARIRKFLLISLVIGAILMLVVGSSYLFKARSVGGTVLTGRDIIWKTSLEALQGKWLFGFGGNTGMMYDAYEATGDYYTLGYVNSHLLHNIYLQVLVEYGILTLIAFVLLVVVLVVKSLTSLFSLSSKDSDFFVLLWSLCVTIMYLFHDLVESCILYIGGPEQFTFIFVMSLLYLNYKKEKI